MPERSVVVDRAGVRRGAQGGSPLVVVDLRGHGTSDKPHGAAAYTANALNGDVFADAEGWIGSRSGGSSAADGSRG
jgi:pimeloyl-ACP methyl ester carboxylesterase